MFRQTSNGKAAKGQRNSCQIEQQDMWRKNNDKVRK